MKQIKYRSLKKYKYQLLEDYEITSKILPFIPFDLPFLKGKEDILTIKKGYCWDGPSGPTIDTKTFIRGSLIHDVYYQLIRLGFIDIIYKNVADRELLHICLKDGMCKFRAWYIYMAVKLFGWYSL